MLTRLARAAVIMLLTLSATSETLADSRPIGSACLFPVDDAAMGRIFDLRDLPDGGMLIGAEKGLFRFSAKPGRVIPASTAEIGRVFDMDSLPDGRVLIAAEKGLFLATVRAGGLEFDVFEGASIAGLAAESGVVLDSVDQRTTGGVFKLYNLRDSAVLIGAENGLFLFRTAARGEILEPIGEIVTGRVFNIHDLPDGAVLIGTGNGLFQLDSAAKRLVHISGATGRVYLMRDLSAGGY